MVGHFNVVIIGAGVSGLTIATNLLETSTSFIILEANGHIGGRCWAKNDIDLGASWVHRCDTIKKFRNIADIDMCKQTSCDSYIDPDVDVVLGVPTDVLREYAKIYKHFTKTTKHATYSTLEHIISHHPMSQYLKQILTYHRAKMGFHEPQHNDIETHAYTYDGMPKRTMYATFVQPLINKLHSHIRLRTPVKSIHRTPSQQFTIQTARGTYTCDQVVYTGTFPALENIDLSPNVISKSLRKFMDKVIYINALKIVWQVDEKSDRKLCNIFNKRRQLHVPGLPWTVMLHEKRGYLYTYAAGPMYEKVTTLPMRKMRADLSAALGINIIDHMTYDFNKNKYFQASYASLFPDNNPHIQDKLLNPSPGFFISSDTIVLSKDFTKWEWCMGTVTGAIRTAEHVSRMMINMNGNNKY